jgi:hypothetical protein
MITTQELEGGIKSLKESNKIAQPQHWNQMRGAIRIMESLIKISKINDFKADGYTITEWEIME